MKKSRAPLNSTESAASQCISHTELKDDNTGSNGIIIWHNFREAFARSIAYAIPKTTPKELRPILDGVIFGWEVATRTPLLVDCAPF